MEAVVGLESQDNMRGWSSIFLRTGHAGVKQTRNCCFSAKRLEWKALSADLDFKACAFLCQHPIHAVGDLAVVVIGK